MSMGGAVPRHARRRWCRPHGTLIILGLISAGCTVVGDIQVDASRAQAFVEAHAATLQRGDDEAAHTDYYKAMNFAVSKGLMQRMEQMFGKVRPGALQEMTQGKEASWGGVYHYLRLIYETNQPNVTMTADVISNNGQLSMLNFNYSKKF